MAMQDVLDGPYGLHGLLSHRLADVNELRMQFTDAQLHADPDDFPPVRRSKPPRKGQSDSEVPSRRAQLITAGLAPLRQLRPRRTLAAEFPETELPAMDAKWYRLARYDSAIVSMNDGTSAALYRRDPAQFRDLMRRTLALHNTFRREWDRLAAEYRGALADIASPEAWDETFRPWTRPEE
jgi:galactofuranosylgalactofuranosylrhamnosyl-N-acetylglucosaminyl-diphospho-decaprenol beta-1,5/1,6-galactofuranosyltransferase